MIDLGAGIGENTEALVLWRVLIKHLLNDLVENYSLDPNDLEPYMPIHSAILAQKRNEVYYLGYYLKRHP